MECVPDKQSCAVTRSLLDIQASFLLNSCLASFLPTCSASIHAWLLPSFLPDDILLSFLPAPHACMPGLLATCLPSFSNVTCGRVDVSPAGGMQPSTCLPLPRSKTQGFVTAAAVSAIARDATCRHNIHDRQDEARDGRATDGPCQGRAAGSVAALYAACSRRHASSFRSRSFDDDDDDVDDDWGSSWPVSDTMWTGQDIGQCLLAEHRAAYSKDALQGNTMTGTYDEYHLSSENIAESLTYSMGPPRRGSFRWCLRNTW